MIQNDVTIIIPTACVDERYEALKRAVKSLSTQDVGCPCILLVANGPRVNGLILEEIGAYPRVKVLRLSEGSLPRAIAVGRTHVTTPFFGYLDDDDEYLPNALSVRLQVLEGNLQAAACATDGYEYSDGKDRLRETVFPEFYLDPLRGLLHANWLASCGALFRSDLVPVEFFDGVTRYFEWTLLAYKLAVSRQVALVNTPTYRLHVSSGSLSRSDAYRLAEPEVLKKISLMNLPNDVRRAVRRRIGAAYHSLSGHFYREGQMRQAWEFHVHSLLQSGGWRYAPYTARLLKF
jgi:glycosyltransferase involved in cell wall biosynthesis